MRQLARRRLGEPDDARPWPPSSWPARDCPCARRRGRDVDDAPGSSAASSTLPTARVIRNAPRRFASSTWSQSSSFIRTRSWSRVMPALLTSRSIRPNRSSRRLHEPLARPRARLTSATTASADRAQRLELLDRSLEPAPRRAQRLPRRRRPRPATRAIARPIPRVPPVTTATRPASGLGLAHARASASAATRLVERRRILDRVAARAVDALEQPGQHPARARPRGRPSAPSRAQALDAVGPADRARHLADQEGPHVVGLRGEPGVHVAHDRARAVAPPPPARARRRAGRRPAP